jgi:tetratricopeptide (TPR) repeat protein
VLAIDPDHAEAHNNLGNIFKEQGKFDDAMAHYGRAIAIRPDYAEAHFNRAEIKTSIAAMPIWRRSKRWPQE